MGVKGANMYNETSEEQADQYGRITKGPFTLKNGAVYTG